MIPDWITAISTAAVAIIAWRQLPLIASQVDGLSKQIRLSREAEENAERRTREWETLRACNRYDSDEILDAATHRLHVASDEGNDYTKPAVQKRDMIIILNYFDSLAVGVAQQLYIEEIVKDHLDIILKKAVEEFIHSGLIDQAGYQRLIELYNKWFNPSRPPEYLPRRDQMP